MTFPPYPYPPVPTPFTANGRVRRPPANLGNTVELVRDVDNIGFKRLLQSRICDDEEGVIGVQTLQIGVEENTEQFDTNAYQGNYRSNILARVGIGRGSGPDVVTFDVRLGVQLSFISDDMKVDVAFAEVDQDTPERVRITGCVTQGPARATRSYVTRTYPRETVNPQTSVDFPVPRFAYSVQFYSSTQLFYTNAEVTFSGANQSTAYAGGQDILTVSGNVILDSLLTEGLKLPNATRVVTVANNALQPFDVTAMFVLNV